MSLHVNTPVRGTVHYLPPPSSSSRSGVMEREREVGSSERERNRGRYDGTDMGKGSNTGLFNTGSFRGRSLTDQWS